MSTPTRAAGKAAVVLVVLVASGAVAGVLWEAVWRPPVGVAVRRAWLRDSGSLGQEFSATGWYVVVAVAVAALVTVLLVRLLPGEELAVLVAVCLGSVLAGWVMYRVGHALGPADPELLARSARRGTRIPSDLVLGGLDRGPRLFRLDTSAMAAFPIGALGGFVVSTLLLRGHDREKDREGLSG